MRELAIRKFGCIWRILFRYKQYIYICLLYFRESSFFRY